MKMYKAAQGAGGSGGIPEGMVEIEVTIDENGDFGAKVTGHGPGATCAGGNDDVTLKELLEGGELVDEGKTAEYWQEQQKKQKVKAPPQTAKPQQPFIGGPFGPKTKKPEKDVTKGFGV